MRRPLLRLVSATPEGFGSPSDPTTRVCLQWLDAARTNAGESLRDQGARWAPSEPGSTAPSPKIAAAKRREACALRDSCLRRRRKRVCGARNAEALTGVAHCARSLARGVDGYV